MIIFQGEKIVFEGKLKDDNGEVMDLSDKTLSFLLRRDDTEFCFWSSALEAANENVITISNNTFTFTLSDSITKTMSIGQYTLEQKVENSDGTIVIGIVEKQIKIAKSNIGLK
jgi:hypothetical protein